MKNPIIISGPCAVESRNQIMSCALSLQERKIEIIRASLWKPRTKPSFDGVGENGIPWFSEITKLGLTAATEVLTPDHVSSLANGINNSEGNLKNVLLWIGSRNQNHFIQQEIAKRILNEFPKEVKLLIKNQPWKEDEHWFGIVEYILNSGFGKDRIILCHRGFSHNDLTQTENFRNPPDFNLAMNVKLKTGLPMLIDPSHIGGTIENVFLAVNQSKVYDFDGLMVEVHSTPTEAKTDPEQQLSFAQFDKLITNYNSRSSNPKWKEIIQQN
ncbi:MAG: hypothetical protein O3A55_03730 [Bacteroidetes bacterium]|nr:hypothetical protein [Bacteroidota bacterium]